MNAPASRIAPPFPLNPSVGESFGNWTWNGVRWVCAPTTGIQVLITSFIASGPYMPSPGLVTAVVETIGGGGAGGSARTAFTGTSGANWGVVAGGGGGGAGGYSRKALPAALVAGGVIVTIGAGGVPDGNNGGAGEGYRGVLSGGNGGETTFGALCAAYGGQGGFGNQLVTAADNVNIAQTADWGIGGGGASGFIGDVNILGTSGWQGDSQWAETTGVGNPSVSLAFGGHGAPGPLGGAMQPAVPIEGGPGIVAAANGQPGGPNTGSGGSGGIATSNNADSGIGHGGAGGAGLCVVTEYCWASATDGGDCMNPPINVNARVAVSHVPWPGPGPCPPGWGEIGPYDGDG